MTDDHDDHGIQTRIVSRVLLRVGQSTFCFKKSIYSFPRLQLGLILFNVQPSGVNLTSDPTNLFLPM